VAAELAARAPGRRGVLEVRHTVPGERERKTERERKREMRERKRERGRERESE
jgi:hypothetical protein